MNAHAHPKLSLIERAAQVYDFDAPLRGGGESVDPAPEPVQENIDAVPAVSPAPSADAQGLHGIVDRAALEEKGFILPDAPVGPLAEEFRIVKRGLLSQVRGKGPGRGQVVMICSARPNDGKTFTAVNLGLSLAGERDVEVLLVDGDIAKPEVLSTLGLEGGAGLLDALADDAVDVSRLVIRTDVGGLSVLPAGGQAHDATERLASRRMAELLDELTADHPRRIILFDSPPALAASAASAIAGHAGQVLMVVRADRTSEADLREAVGLVGACGDIRLVLNGAAQGPGKKRFSYYGPDR